jgi:aspartate/tyrosine/aromatic aminotransferase
MVSQENHLRLSDIISKGWFETVEEDNSYLRIYLGSNTICYRLQGFSFQTVYYNPRVGLNILLLYEASDIDLQPLVPSMKILEW